MDPVGHFCLFLFLLFGSFLEILLLGNGRVGDEVCLLMNDSCSVLIPRWYMYSQ